MPLYATSTGRTFRAKPGRRSVAARDRIERNIVVAPNGCWIFTGHINKRTGYGSFLIKINGTVRGVPAHRASYEAYVACIPDGLEIDHLCRERACVNWRHLEAVTPSVNQQRRPRASACKQGHPYANGNAKTARNGSRRCRICLAAWRKVNDRSSERRKRRRPNASD